MAPQHIAAAVTCQHGNFPACLCNREIEEKTRAALLGGSIDINDLYEEKDDEDFTEDIAEEAAEPEAVAA